MALWINTFQKGGEQNENQASQQSEHQAQTGISAGPAAVQTVRGGCKGQKPAAAEHALSHCPKGVLAYAGVHIAL